MRSIEYVWGWVTPCFDRVFPAHFVCFKSQFILNFWLFSKRIPILRIFTIRGKRETLRESQVHLKYCSRKVNIEMHHFKPTLGKATRFTVLIRYSYLSFTTLARCIFPETEVFWMRQAFLFSCTQFSSHSFYITIRYIIPALCVNELMFDVWMIPTSTTIATDSLFVLVQFQLFPTRLTHFTQKNSTNVSAMLIAKFLRSVYQWKTWHRSNLYSKNSLTG